MVIFACVTGKAWVDEESTGELYAAKAVVQGPDGFVAAFADPKMARMFCRYARAEARRTRKADQKTRVRARRTEQRNRKGVDHVAA